MTSDIQEKPNIDHLDKKKVPVWSLTGILYFKLDNMKKINQSGQVHLKICMLTLVSELALLGRGEPESWGRVLTNPLDSQPNTPVWAWLLRKWRKIVQRQTDTH